MRPSIWLFALILCLLLILPVVGQTTMDPSEPEATETPEPPKPLDLVIVERGTVEVESAFVRVLPGREFEAAASVFERDVLEIVGRNLDGLWFEVRRPNRQFNLGWISAELVDIDFPPEVLPMTDSETGLVGATPIDEDNIPVYMTAEANLRVEPIRTADIVAVVPLDAVLPATGRDTETAWLYVNYRGNAGWVNISTVRRPPNVQELPDLTFIEEDVGQLNALVIPPEIQLEQLRSFRNFVVSSQVVAAQLVILWENVLAGEVMPCEPPGFVVEYLITAADVRELPELNRHVPRYNEGVILLNEAIEPLYICGVLQVDVVSEARNDAINADIIMRATIQALDSLEALILEINKLSPQPTATPTP